MLVDPRDLPLYDSVLLEEIALLGEVMAVAGAHPGAVPRNVLDVVLAAEP